jgi:GntR family transcriptional regulator
MQIMAKLYQEICEFLLNKIKNGEYRPDDKVPSENELAEMFKVSRMTARKAVDSLVSRNYLYKQAGKGTYVTNQKEKIKIYFDGSMGFNERTLYNNKVPYTVVLKFEKKSHNQMVQQKLKIDEGDVYYIERLRYVDGIPAVFEITYMPVYLFPDLQQQDLSISKYDYVHSLGHTIKGNEKEFFAVIPDENIQRQLQLNEHTPVFKVELTSSLDNDLIFEYTKIFYNQKQFRFLEKYDR